MDGTGKVLSIILLLTNLNWFWLRGNHWAQMSTNVGLLPSFPLVPH